MRYKKRNLTIHNTIKFKIELNCFASKMSLNLNKFLSRCEAGIGNVLYEKAYKFLSENNNQLKQEEIRKKLIGILD